jgi:hypothetical protein
MIDYFKEINRALTALIAGVIGAAILIGGMYFVAANDLIFVVLSLLFMYLAIQVSQLLNYYFYKLLDKEAYIHMGKNMWSGAILNLVLLICSFPFVFLIGSEVLIAVLFFIHILNVTVREDSFLVRRISNLIGTFVVLMFTIFISISFKDVIGTNPLMQISQVGVLIPALMFVGSVFEFMGQLISKFVLTSESVDQ